MREFNGFSVKILEEVLDGIREFKNASWANRTASYANENSVRLERYIAMKLHLFIDTHDFPQAIDCAKEMIKAAEEFFAKRNTRCLCGGTTCGECKGAAPTINELRDRVSFHLDNYNQMANRADSLENELSSARTNLRLALNSLENKEKELKTISDAFNGTIPTMWPKDTIGSIIQRIAALRSSLICPICFGQKNESGIPCACNGTGSIVEAFSYVHGEWAKQAVSDRLRK